MEGKLRQAWLRGASRPVDTRPRGTRDQHKEHFVSDLPAGGGVDDAAAPSLPGQNAADSMMPFSSRPHLITKIDQDGPKTRRKGCASERCKAVTNAGDAF